ncbi:hypothetical protein GCM10022251_57930 [Phytohabitans flavus]|uniref:Uncharacterized protein n=1 Tax=Phytohabitans flavus TaxID=1076124 RepID=A0A6F8XTF2_9ACTN|nr:hypothetical protein [Phytohabitans flavus]BCB77114.1 hypothetical protein Pflav_035240 [Phytohabitans flavus]
MTDPSSEPRKPSMVERRKQKIAEEIARNRRGEHRVPTWVLALILGVILAGWVALVVFS